MDTLFSLDSFYFLNYNHNNIKNNYNVGEDPPRQRRKRREEEEDYGCKR